MLLELLNRWAALEPAHAKLETKAEESFIWLPTCDYRSYRFPLHAELGDGDLGNLQRAVQHAIAHRQNWALKLHYNPVTAEWGAHLFWVDADEGDSWSWTPIADAVWHAEPAIALLTAYLEALEASNGNPDRGL